MTRSSRADAVRRSRTKLAIAITASCLTASTLAAMVAAAQPAAADWRFGATDPSARGALNGAFVRMTDGKILVAGGQNGTTRLGTVQIYDPIAQTWTPVAPLGDARTQATGQQLADGRVLVCGGTGGPNTPGVPYSCERYDPALDVWLSTASMPFNFTAPRSVALHDGRVLVWGGSLNAGVLYDPATNKWKFTTSMAQIPGTAAVGLVLTDGRVLVAGSTTLSTDVVYDPATDTWTKTDSGVVRAQPSLTMLANGRVLVAGGFNGSTTTPLASAQIFDPAANTWSAAAPMLQAHALHAAVGLPDGRVLVTGGQTLTSATSPESELYDPATNAWTVEASLQIDRIGAVPFLADDGTALVLGGADSTGLYVAFPELYDPPDTSFVVTGQLAKSRENHTATLLPNGKVLVAGGYDNVNDLSSAELYDPAAGTWSSAGNMGRPHRNGVAVLLGNGKVLVAGGSTAGTSDRIADLYDPATNSWSLGGTMGTYRVAPLATVLPSGKVLFAGGYDGADFLKTTELYDPATNSWSGAAPMNSAHFIGVISPLPGGKVLVAGGFAGTVDTDVAEVYDPVANTWTKVASMNTGVEAAAAVALPDGKVLVAAGQRTPNFFPPNGQVYDPVADTWTDTGPFPTGVGRVQPSLALDTNGEPMLIGGTGGYTGGLPSTVDVYDERANAWYEDGDLSFPRSGQTATVLAGGRVLVAGGGNSVLASVSDLSAVPAKVTVTTAFTPKAIKVKKWGSPIRWSVTQGTHSIVESDGLGLPSNDAPTPLFDSGPLTGTSFSYVIPAAGTYHYQSTLGEHPALKGTIKIPLQASMDGEPIPRIDVHWSTSRMPDYVFDVEYRFQPAGGSFGPWTPWSPPGQSGGWTSAHGLFTPAGGGVYQFKARLHQLTTGVVSGFSPAAKVTVPD